MSKHLINKNHGRRFGAYCSECDKKLGAFRLEGRIDNRSVAFCSSKCCDDYVDRNKESGNE